MKTFTLGEGGAALHEAPQPSPGPTQLLVKVHAAGLNRVDLLTFEAARQGEKSSHGAALGRELSGTVVAVGAAVGQFREGDRVMGSTRGALSEYALLEQALALPVPDQALSLEEAAVLPVALNTMHDALVTHGQLRAGQTVLVQGASSGVGLMAMEIADVLGAAFVIGTSRTEARRTRLADHGADLALDSGSPDWIQQVLDATHGQGVDLIIDQVGAPLANQNMQVTALGGRIINVGRLGGTRGEFDYDLHALRRIAYLGVTFRTRTPDQVGEIAARMLADLAEPIGAGKLKLPIDSRFPLEASEQALDYMAENQHFGKILIDM